MLFNSLQYVVFFPAVVLVHFLLPPRLRNPFLIAASIVFYMSWEPGHIVLLLAATVATWLAGLWIAARQEPPARRVALVAGLVVNLGFLFFFKYYNFFAVSTRSLFELVGVPLALPRLSLLLPIGISFYTFAAVGYLVDVYRREIPAERSFFRLFFFKAFFAQLVAGPIARGGQLLPQLDVPHRFAADRLIDALRLMLWGFFKKMVIADRLAGYVDTVYNHVQQHNGLTILIATYFFAVQIYCDFSGYSDIAIASAKILGFELITNFETPYFSTSIQEFWRRWHISLSTWLRDYLYVPLGGNRGGTIRTYRNLFITMLLGGLWHGARWNFVIWGALHGLYLSVERAARLAGTGSSALGRLLRRVVVFHLVLLAWIFFRANTLADALAVLRSISRLSLGAAAIQKSVLVMSNDLTAAPKMAAALTLILILFAVESRLGRRKLEIALAENPVWLRWAICDALLLAILFLGVMSSSPFIYSQF